MQVGLQAELSQCKAKLQEAQAEVEALQQRAMDSQSSTAALQADLHATSAALADLTCTTSSCSLMLKHAVTGPSTLAGSHSPEVQHEGGSTSEAYLVRQAASAKADLRHASEDIISALKQAASKQLQVEVQITQCKASIQQAAQAMQQCVLPSLAARVQSASESVSFAEQAVDTAAEVLAYLVQQAVMASTSIASKLKAADSRSNDLAASNARLQGIQDSLHSELQAEQVPIPQPGSVLAALWTKSHSTGGGWIQGFLKLSSSTFQFSDQLPCHSSCFAYRFAFALRCKLIGASEGACQSASLVWRTGA